MLSEYNNNAANRAIATLWEAVSHSRGLRELGVRVSDLTLADERWSSARFQVYIRSRRLSIFAEEGDVVVYRSAMSSDVFDPADIDVILDHLSAKAKRR